MSVLRYSCNWYSWNVNKKLFNHYCHYRELYSSELFISSSCRYCKFSEDGNGKHKTCPTKSLFMKFITEQIKAKCLFHSLNKWRNSKEKLSFSIQILYKYIIILIYSMYIATPWSVTLKKWNIIYISSQEWEIQDLLLWRK